jgi:chromosome segregation ATPase
LSVVADSGMMVAMHVRWGGKMSRYSFFAAVAVLASGLAACVFYYKTADVRSGFDKALRDVDRNIAKAERDRSDKARICEPLAARIAGFGDLLRQMDERLKQLREHRGELVQLRERFERVARGKRRIRSDRPEWEEVKSIRAAAEELVEERAQQTANQYKEATDQLGQRCVRAGGRPPRR